VEKGLERVSADVQRLAILVQSFPCIRNQL
jgi:hypothetical protein